MTATRVIDISVLLEPAMFVFPGNTGVDLRTTAAIDDGAPSNLSELRIGTHAGTHVDAPAHFFAGAPGTDALDLDVLVGDAVVVDLSGVSGHIGPDDLDRSVPASATRVLWRTRNSALWRRPGRDFPTDYVALSPAGAQWVIDRGVRLVGTDFLSIEPFANPGRPVHRLLLGAGVVIVEGLDLTGVDPGPATLACLPLRLAGADGAPARAVLIR